MYREWSAEKADRGFLWKNRKKRLPVFLETGSELRVRGAVRGFALLKIEIKEQDLLSEKHT